MTILEFAYTENRKNYWKCQCDWGNVCYVSTSQLTNGETFSCGCKNDENRANLLNLDRGLVDGTMKCGIKDDRKLNRNNTSGVGGFHFFARETEAFYFMFGVFQDLLQFPAGKLT